MNLSKKPFENFALRGGNTGKKFSLPKKYFNLGQVFSACPAGLFCGQGKPPGIFNGRIL
jgi:hypothetical protein